MKKVLVVFGSESDAPIYEELLNELKACGIEAELKICSAHRQPKELDELIESEECDLFIAGAGLSAALPGVIASKTAKPVIGIPCAGAFEGLDAFLSVHQLPKGVPVLGVGVNNAKQAAEEAAKVLKCAEKIAVVQNAALKKFEEKREKLFGKMRELGLQYEMVSERSSEGTVFIEMLDLDSAESVSAGEALTIFVPMKKDSKAEDALKTMKLAVSGLWVGLNNVDNAAISAQKLLNK